MDRSRGQRLGFGHKSRAQFAQPGNVRRTETPLAQRCCAMLAAPRRRSWRFWRCTEEARRRRRLNDAVDFDETGADDTAPPRTPYRRHGGIAIPEDLAPFIPGGLTEKRFCTSAAVW